MTDNSGLQPQYPENQPYGWYSGSYGPNQYQDAATASFSMTPDAAPADDSPGTEAGPSRRPWRGWIPIVVGFVAFFLGVIVGGVADDDPTESRQYGDLEAEATQAQQRLERAEKSSDELQSELDELNGSHEDQQAELDDLSAELSDREEDLDTRENDLDDRSSDLDDREGEITSEEDHEAENSFGTGTYTVGTDINPGTYRTEDPVSSGFCYWGIYTSGSNKDDIISNDIVEGGTPTVTIEEGQDFESTDCGTWVAQ